MIRHAFNDGWTVRENSTNFGAVSQYPEQPVSLPHDAVIRTARRREATVRSKKGYYENGTWEYRKLFFVPGEWKEKKILLEFDGVYKDAMVYINGDYAGQRPYGYSMFTVDTDPFLKYGEENEISVTVRTGDDSRWYSGAGIYRDVTVLESTKVYIPPHSVKMATPEVSGDQAEVCISMDIRNETAFAKYPVKVLCEIESDDGSCVAGEEKYCTLMRGDPNTVRFRLFVSKPKLWSAEHPNLYRCTVRLCSGENELLDVSMERFGIRKLTLDYRNGLQVNGCSVKLRGACIHHDNGLLGGISIYSAEHRRITRLKEAGFNAVRMAHHPAGQALLDVCDEVGMYVLDEAFDMWTRSKCSSDYSLDFPMWWEADIRAMVDRDYNHPSVIIYSIGNETPETGSQAGAVWCRKLAECIRGLDSTRYTTIGINGMFSVMDLLMKKRQAEQGMNKKESGEINTMMANAGAEMKVFMTMDAITERTAEAFGCVDIAGYNYMDSRYEMDMKRFPNRIICGTETYAKDIWKNWKYVRENGNIIGDFTWTGWDYLGEAGIGKIYYSKTRSNGTIYADHPTFLAQTGDLDITGLRNPISYYREIVFGLRKEPYLAIQPPCYYGKDTIISPWSWSNAVPDWNWEGFEGKPVKVEIYSAAPEVELLLNGKSLGRKTLTDEDRCRVIFDTVYEPGSLQAVSYSDGQETGRRELRGVEGKPEIHLHADRANDPTGRNDLIYVEIEIADSLGTRFIHREYDIHIQVSGAGALEAFGCADPDSEEGFHTDTHKTYMGRALAIIRHSGHGCVEVQANTPELEPKRMELRLD